MNLDQTFERLWNDYIQLNPDAGKIYNLFLEREKRVINDHIALRTFDVPEVNIDVLARPFDKEGYIKKGRYVFKEKKLTACHLEHPDPEQPKVFISQFQAGTLPQNLQDMVHRLIGQISPDLLAGDEFITAGLPWRPLSFEDYEALRTASEYAAWVAAFGYRANHFTVSVNHLESFKNLSEVNEFLKSRGFKLNETGGTIKGSPKEYLEQSSILANAIDVQFSDGIHKIPACYYEFALRYPLPSGELFQGFVTGSADKIFHSTDKQ